MSPSCRRFAWALLGSAALCDVAHASSLPSGDASAVGMVVNTLASLAIFFFGVYEMTEGMRTVAEERLEVLLARATRNPVLSVITGATTTAVVGSSSIVTILTVGLVSSGLLAFANALGVIMGANIGTTMTSQLFAFGLSDYFGVVLVLGAILRFLPRRPRARAWGTAIMGIGFVFLGLEMLETTLAPLKDAVWFREAIANMENVWFGILMGAVITGIIQSSSATMGVVIVMASQGAISLPAGIAIMMGAELGTCADTLASTLGQTRAAVRTGLFHLLFNVFNVLLLVGFTEQLAALATAITPGDDAPAVARQIANAHVAFNTLGVLAALPFTRVLARLMIWILPSAAAGLPEPATARPEPDAIETVRANS